MQKSFILIWFLLVEYLQFINGIQQTDQQTLPTILSIATRDTEYQYENNILTIPTYKKIKLFFIGNNLSKIKHIAFSKTRSEFGKNCELSKFTEAFPVFHESDHISYSYIHLESTTEPNHNFSICARTVDGKISKWSHQESTRTNLIIVYQGNLPLTLKQKIMYKVLLGSVFLALFLLSGLISGLNLGLMSLDNAELSLIIQAGEEHEKKYAKKILPIRNKGNFLLCSLLIVNVVVNNVLAVLTDNLLGNGMISVVLSSSGIVLFGEIIPQAICSRHGLLVGAKTIVMTKIVMVLTGIVSFPLGKLLDLILGEELRTVYNRKELDALIKDQQEQGLVDAEEAGIMGGALQINTKQVHQIMTKICDVYMLPYNEILDFNVISEIESKGYSRIPVYHEDRNNVIAILNVKDLITVIPDHRIPLSTVCKFYMHAIIRVKADTCLKQVFELFIGGRSHLALIENNCDELIGIVTLEDIVEEIFQREIIDETDIYTDNVFKKRSNGNNLDFRATMGFSDGNQSISLEYKQAVLRFLVSEIDVFSPEIISTEILQSLLNADVIFEHKYHHNKNNDLYEVDTPTNFAILILKGELDVSAQFNSNEFNYQAGAFKMLGHSVLKKALKNYRNQTAITNFEFLTVPLIEKVAKMSETVSNFDAVFCNDTQYLKITVEHYIFALILTQLEREGKIDEKSLSVQNTHNYFQLEWNKLFKKKQKLKYRHTYVELDELRKTGSL